MVWDALGDNIWSDVGVVEGRLVGGLSRMCGFESDFVSCDGIEGEGRISQGADVVLRVFKTTLNAHVVLDTVEGYVKVRDIQNVM